VPSLLFNTCTLYAFFSGKGVQPTKESNQNILLAVIKVISTPYVSPSPICNYFKPKKKKDLLVQIKQTSTTVVEFISRDIRRKKKYLRTLADRFKWNARQNLLSDLVSLLVIYCQLVTIL
jgi:hypothetical protein